MKSFVAITSLVAGAGLVLASPTPTIKERATEQCGQWDTQTTGSYTLYQDLWGESAGTGSQCSEIDGLSGNTISWDTTWSWSGGSSSVKSYANVINSKVVGTLSSLSTIPTVWDYSYSGSSIVADVSYDCFLGSSASASASYEIMIWLAALGGAGPISSTGKTVATPSIAGHTWNLFSGPNGDTTVYSFVAQSEITSFSGDLKSFFTYLIDDFGVSSSEYLQSCGAGTEPFTGSDAKLTVSAYSITT